MLESTRQHENYWTRRKIDWNKAYFETADHPHRNLIIEELKKIHNWGSLLEVGCASGPNLYRVLKEFPYIQVGGIDINKDAIETAKKNLERYGLRLAILEVAPADNLFFSDKSADVVLTDMTLIYVGKDKIWKALNEIKRVARNHVILVEFHNSSFWERFKLKWNSGYNAYNYEKMLEELGFWDIELKKISEEDWPNGEPQKTFGYLIHARI